MSTAIIGLASALAGVVVGALLTEWREQRRERRARHDEVRVAARLIRHELEATYTRVLTTPRGSFAANEWSEHRAILARTMDEAGWRDVAAAYAILELVGSGEELSDEANTLIRRAFMKLDALLDWSRDESREDQVLLAYERYLIDLQRKKRAEAARIAASRGQRRP